MNLSDGLVRRSQSGDMDAMGQLLSIVEDFVFDFARTHIQNTADADDVAMKALGAVWERLPKSAPISSFDDWVAGIVWHKINDYRRECYRDKSIPMSSVYKRDGRGLEYDEVEALGGVARPLIRYGKDAERDAKEAEKAFRAKP